MHKQYTYTTFLMLIFFPLHGGWIIERLEGLIATSPTHPPFFKTRAEIERDVRQWKSEGKTTHLGLLEERTNLAETTIAEAVSKLNPKNSTEPAAQGLISQYEQTMSYNTFAILLNSIIQKQIDTKNQNTYRYKNKMKITEKKKNALFYLLNILPKHNFVSVSVGCSESYMIYYPKKQGYALHIGKQDIEAGHMAGSLFHEYIHAVRHDPIIKKTLQFLDPTIEQSPAMNNYLKNREYLADIGLTLMLPQVGNTVPVKKNLRIIKKIKDHYYVQPTIVKCAVACNTAFSLLAVKQHGKKIPLIVSAALLIPNLLMILQPMYQALFDGGPKHPSPAERWLAMNVVEKSLRVEQEMQRRNNEQK